MKIVLAFLAVFSCASFVAAAEEYNPDQLAEVVISPYVVNICVRYEQKQTCGAKVGCNYMCAATAAALSTFVPAGGWIVGAAVAVSGMYCANVCSNVPDCQMVNVCVEWAQP